MEAMADKKKGGGKKMESALIDDIKVEMQDNSVQSRNSMREKRKRAPAQRFRPSEFAPSKDPKQDWAQKDKAKKCRRILNTSAEAVSTEIRVKSRCSSCQLVEPETLRCNDCRRWYCFGCTCVCLSVLDGASGSSNWRCPSCSGQAVYDKDLTGKIELFRERIKRSDYSLTELDEFSQLVFDLFCCCAWKEWFDNVQILIDIVRSQLDQTANRIDLPAILPYHAIHYSKVVDSDLVKRIAEAYSQHALKQAFCTAKRHVEGDCSITSLERWTRSIHVRQAPGLTNVAAENGERLRIGYLSSQLSNHPTLDLIFSALEWHKRLNRFEVFIYATTPGDESILRRRLEDLFEVKKHMKILEQWWSDERCAELIAADHLAILVNLDGHTEGERNGIFALRPAPMQVFYLGYPGTIGANYIDYALVDSVVAPHSHNSNFSEVLLRVPHCYQTNSFLSLYKDVFLKPPPSRKEHRLPPEPAVVLCCFNRLGRVTEELFSVWMSILRRVPTAVLWLYRHPSAAVPRLLQAAAAAGIQRRRLLFAEACDKGPHLQRLRLADLCLDTVVHNGHTTGSDVLWAGVPMITVCGECMASRVGASLLAAVKMPQLVARDLAHYEHLAVSLASDPAQLRRCLYHAPAQHPARLEPLSAVRPHMVKPSMALPTMVYSDMLE